MLAFFPSILLRIFKEIGVFGCLSLSNINPSHPLLKSGFFFSFKVRVSTLSIVSPVFLRCRERESHYSEKTWPFPLFVHCVAATVRTNLIELSFHYSVEFFRWSELSLSWLQLFMILWRFTLFLAFLLGF